MTRLVCLLAFALFAATLSQGTAEAQQLNIGLGGIQYSGYGQGAYGPGYRYYGPRGRVYSGYGYGPYGYGSGNQYQFPSSGAGSAYQFPANGYYNNGYYRTGTYGQYYAPVYSPFGFSMTTF